MTPSGKLTTLHCFDGTDGESPLAALVQATNGDLYGTTFGGGANNDGAVFSLSVGLGRFVMTQPTSGKVGAAVKILGTDLTGATSVTFNGTAAVFEVVSSSLINHNQSAGWRDDRHSPGGDTQWHAFEQRALPGSIKGRGSRPGAPDVDAGELELFLLRGSGGASREPSFVLPEPNANCQ